jgi:peroxiredoxin Q/BCP
MMTCEIGMLAPDFTLAADNDQSVTLSHLRGKKIVLYFYPKDSTPGCTQESCDFRDQFPQFEKKGVLVFGISKDSVTSHQKFKQKYNLPFPLLVDSDASVCVAYGVMNKKSMFGKSFLAIQRSTFLIDENGRLQAIWRKVKVPGHVEQVCNEIDKT